MVLYVYSKRILVKRVRINLPSIKFLSRRLALRHYLHWFYRYIYIYTYIGIYIYIYIYRYIYIYTYIDIHIYIYAYVYIYRYIYIYTYTYINIYIYIYIYFHMILYFSYKEQLSRTFGSFYTSTIIFSLLQRIQFSLGIHESVENNYFFIVFTPYHNVCLAQN